jgi:hypothetical protein
MGSLEAWLLLRSLRTLHLRVPRQSATATAIAQWLDSASFGKSFDGIPGNIITKVWHSSLQKKDARGFEPNDQMEGGWNATFAILVSYIGFWRYCIYLISVQHDSALQIGVCRPTPAFIEVLCGKSSVFLQRLPSLMSHSLQQASEASNP